VVAFSLYVREESTVARYLGGLVPNMEALPLLYPGWVARVYTNISRDNAHVCSVICRYPHLRWCDIRNVPGRG
jgi:hypothetical protein